MALTRDLVRQGHVTLQVIYLISGPIHAEDMFFWFPRFVGSRKSRSYRPDTCSWRVTLYVKVTWPYMWPIWPRALYMLEIWIVLFPWFLWSRKWMAWEPNAWFKRLASVRQGHVTLQVTYLISGPVHARDMICFHGFLGQGSQWHVNLIRVTLYIKVTWPHRWPISPRALYMLETWIVLFP